MSSDDSDKTVFQQVGSSGDRTTIKPMPGGRGLGGASARPQPGGTGHPPPAYAPTGNIAADAAHFHAVSGLNPLLDASATLIAVYEKTRQSLSHNDVGGLHNRLTSEIRSFEAKLREQGIKQEVVLSARYILCTALDEAVLNTPWGSESAWAQRTLLSVFHNEAHGGEKFYLILDRLKQSPSENIDMLELFYILLSLGFEGKYRLSNRGRDAIEQLKDDLFSIIRVRRGEYERTLSPIWEGLGTTRNTLAEYIPMWVVVSVVAVALFFSYSGFRYWLYESATPVAEQLEQIYAEEVSAESK